MIYKIAKINKKIIAILMSVLILLSSIVVAYTVNAADTELEETSAKAILGFNNTFSLNSEGKAVALKAKFSVAKTDLKSGFAMAQSSIGGKNVYCLEMGNHPYSKDMDSDNEKAWNSLGYNKRELIKNILVLGLEGTLKGKEIATFNATNYSVGARSGSYKHRVYKGDAYGLKGVKFTDSEIYIATQLLIWEVTNGDRKSGNPSYTSKSLLKGYWRDNVPSGESKGNSHIRAVYRFISERLSTINVIPEFAVSSLNIDNISTYSFKITYDKTATNKYEITPSSRTLRTGNKNVLKHYTGLIKNKAYRYKNTSTGNFEYLNVKSEKDRNGNLKLTPFFSKDKTKYQTGYSVVSNKSSEYSSEESDVPIGSGANNINKQEKGLDVNIIAYAPNGDAKAQKQVGVKPDACTLDPRDAHFNVSVSFKDETEYSRDFSIQKDMRIKSETVASGESSDDLDAMESGYYFYITFPDATKEELATVNKGKLVYQNTESQNYKAVLDKKEKGIYYNSRLGEYYTIVGPTDRNGVTGSVAESMKKYVDKNITEGNMPYGNYYIYELGRRRYRVSDTSAKAYMDVANYEMPEGISSYSFTYKDHLEAFQYYHSLNKTMSVTAKDSNGKSHDFNVKIRAIRDNDPSTNLVDYFSRLKRIYRGKNSLTEITPTVVNLVSTPIKFQKYSDDGVYKNVVFQVDRYDKDTKSWSSVDLSNMIKEAVYKKNYLDKLKLGKLITYSDKSTTDEDYGTEELGYTPDIYFPTGKYRLTELGTLNKSGNIIGLKPYVITPEPYVFVIGDYSDDSNDDAVDIIDEFVRNNKVLSYNELNSIKVTIENLANLELRLFKTDDDTGKALDGATYGLYNSRDNCIGEVETATNNINGKNCKGTAVFKGLSFDEEYYIKELKAPSGYELDNTKYKVRSDNLSAGGNAFDKMSFRKMVLSNKFINYIDLNVGDKPTEVPVSKTDFSGKMLKGAKLWVYRVEDSSKVNTYLNKFKNDTSKINENDPEIKGVLKDYWVSDNKTHIIKRLSAHSTYVLREISPPDGYILSNNIVFTVNDDKGNVSYTGKPSGVDDIVMKDDSTKIAFNKVNEEGKSISGAVLQVKDSSGKIVREWTTDGKEYVLDGVLVAGATYTLHEVSAPNVEYELAKDISFKVGTDGVKQVVTMKDNYKRGSVTVHKKDEKGNILTGAEFELYKEDGTKVTSTLVKEGSYTVGGSVGTYVVDSKGTFKIDKLRFGSYYLIETKAPEGRMPYGDKIKFTIKDDATLNFEFTVNDDNSVMMNTGGNGYTVPMTVGIAVLLVSILSLIYLKRRKYNSK